MTTDSMDNTNMSPSRANGLQFHFFQQLPTELQLKIWDYEIPPPRVFTVTSKVLPRIIPGTQCRASPEHVPAILQVCQLSRHFALKTLQLSFEEQLIKPVYFSPVQDTLYMSDEYTLMSFVGGNHTLGTYYKIRHVRSIAVGDPFEHPLRLIKHLRAFTDLEKVMLELPDLPEFEEALRIRMAKNFGSPVVEVLSKEGMEEALKAIDNQQ